MTTIPLFSMSPPTFTVDRLHTIAKQLGFDGDGHEAEGATVIQSDDHVLAAAGPCGRQPGLVLYTDRRRSLGAIHDRPLAADAASERAMSLLSELDLLPDEQEEERLRVQFEPTARVTNAVVFDGKERRTVAARTDFALRLTINGIAVNGPRTRVRIMFGTDEAPIVLYRALWERLADHEDSELIREHEVLATLERTLRGRSDCDLPVRVHSSNLVYMADEFRGAPDLLAPYYLVEVQSPMRGPRAVEGDAPRQLLRVPAWRTALTSIASERN